MADNTVDHSGAASARGRPRRRMGRRVLIAITLILMGLGLYAWFSREQIASDLISRQLDALGLEARYKVTEIGPKRQVLTDIVIGDPANPDLTIERAEFTLVARITGPGLGKVRLIKPRLFGSYRGGKFSFGVLDPLLFEQERTEPFTFPDMDLAVDDGRALVETDFGSVGFKTQGSGNLRGGFKGILAASAPELTYDGCAIQGVSLFGQVSVDSERPGFSGPMRLGGLACPKRQLTSGVGVLDVKARLDRGFDGLEGTAKLSVNALSSGAAALGTLMGDTQFSWRKDALVAKYDLAANGLDSPPAKLASLGVEGTLRAHGGFERVEVQGDLTGSGIQPGAGLNQTLDRLGETGEGTLLSPILAQLRTAFAREGRSSTLSANLTARKTGTVLSLVVPQLTMRGSSGQSLLAVSRFQAGSTDGGAGGGAVHITGNFVTGGKGMPRISGRMESRGGGDAMLRLRMAEYGTGDSTVSVDEMLIAQGRDGTLGFSGTVRASGPIPGGSARGLIVPVTGNYAPERGLFLLRGCTAVRFDELSLQGLTLERRGLTLCAPPGGAILRSDSAGTRIAAGVASLDIAGKLMGTPIAIRSGAVGFAYPGHFNARDVDVALGAEDSAMQFTLAEVEAKLGDEIAGRFSGVDALLHSVPLDVLAADGAWRVQGGQLTLSEMNFRLEDREKPGRFEPLVARDATLTLGPGSPGETLVQAQAVMREPGSDREVTRAALTHNLGTGAGYADLDVGALVFDDQMQPDTVTGLALGIVANTYGTVTGHGRIDWNAREVTSSGEFATSNLDLAAAFGPVNGVSGTIIFTDLLNLVTAPHQKLHIMSFNPGIEVEEGDLEFELREGYQLVIHEGRWPFIGGELVLEATKTWLTRAGERHYALQLNNVDAARFVERMELANIAATGTFSGRIPLVFDEDGGRIVNGYLKARPPGGNIAYVGELTYKDLSAMANFAFDALRSLNYTEMEVLLDGSLTGEIVTKVRFDGIRQGESAKQNFVTRQLAKLPIRFNVNIRAPFYKLITAIQTMYDPAFVRDPREIGLLDAQGNKIKAPAYMRPGFANPTGQQEQQEISQDEGAIQPPAIEDAP